MGKPTIAAVDGPARAGGMTIAISCDMSRRHRIARKALMASSKSDRQNIPGADRCYLAAPQR